LRPDSVDGLLHLAVAVERLTVDMDGVPDRVTVTLTWVGGQACAHEVGRPVRQYEQTADFDRLLARIRELRVRGLSLARGS
jgi:hypothetical protein